MKKLLIILPLFLLAEVDPFAAGLKSGYGLTDDEKAILQNKKSISRLKVKVDNIKEKVDNNSLKIVNFKEKVSTIEDKVSAFSSILDELSSLKVDLIKVQKNRQNIDNNVTHLQNEIKQLKDRITVLEDNIAQIVAVQNKNFKTLKASIQELLKQVKTSSSISKKDAFYLGRTYFFNGKLDKAKELFLQSFNQGYLRATSSYYLGEIEYKKKHYKAALGFYKKSVSIYPKKTSYMARLLYHTAMSFKRLGNEKLAKITLKKLIKDYSSSKYANLAQKELEKLK